jgi:heat shock protein 1/8
VVANAQGNHSTPSVVAFQDAEQLIGEVALGQAPKNPNNTVFECKRLLGKKLDDTEVQKDSTRWRFTLCQREGKVCVQVMH